MKTVKTFFLLLTVLLFFTPHVQIEPVTAPAQNLQQQDSLYTLYYKIEIPRFFKKDKEKIVQHIAYTLYYEEEHEQAKWVAYELTKEEALGKHKRKDKFITDQLVTTGSAENKDYAGSGYDRGHLAPAADMLWSDTAMKESFYYSNMSPQLHKFNNGIWKELERKVRLWAIDYGSIFIVTGPVLKPELPKMKNSRVSIPEKYYKVVLHLSDSSKKAIGFLMDQASIKKKLDAFAVPVDSIEKITGINFFPFLPDALERKLERKVNAAEWKFD